MTGSLRNTTPSIDANAGLQTDNSLCFEKRGITPNLSFSTPDSFVACGMVKAGLGVALVNRVIADELSDAVAYVPLDPPEVIDICAVTPADDVISPAAKIFKSYALEFLEDFWRRFGTSTNTFISGRPVSRVPTKP